MSVRPCIRCGDEQHESMGCVLARDICAALDGQRQWDEIRELCQSCAVTLGDGLASMTDDDLVALRGVPS